MDRNYIVKRTKKGGTENSSANYEIWGGGGGCAGEREGKKEGGRVNRVSRDSPRRRVRPGKKATWDGACEKKNTDDD